jgi:hypothetical protein
VLPASSFKADRVIDIVEAAVVSLKEQGKQNWLAGKGPLWDV